MGNGKLIESSMKANLLKTAMLWVFALSAVSAHALTVGNVTLGTSTVNRPSQIDIYFNTALDLEAGETITVRFPINTL